MMQGQAYHTILDADALGRAAAAAYDLAQPVSCSLFNSGVNEIYFVRAGENHTMPQAVLRVARARRLGAYGVDDYHCELALLDFLHAGGVPVSRPLTRRDGHWLGWMETPEGRRAWALFEYVPGEPPASLEGQLAAEAGRLLAQVHNQADQFQPPCARFHLDASFLIDEPLARLQRFPGLAGQDLALIEREARSLRSWLSEQPTPGSAYGWVHGDYWWSNLHLTPQGLALIDFDFCGYGWRAYDLAALLVTSKILRYPLEVSAFLDGYQALRPLSPADTAAIPFWERIRMIWVFGLWTSFENLRGTRWFYEFFTPAFARYQEILAQTGYQR